MSCTPTLVAFFFNSSPGSVSGKPHACWSYMCPCQSESWSWAVVMWCLLGRLSCARCVLEVCSFVLVNCQVSLPTFITIISSPAHLQYEEKAACNGQREPDPWCLVPHDLISHAVHKLLDIIFNHFILLYLFYTIFRERHGTRLQFSFSPSPNLSRS